MKKKYIFSILFIVVIVFIMGSLSIKHNYNKTNNKKSDNEFKNKVETYNVSTYITSDMTDNVQKSSVMAQFTHEYTPEYMLEQSDAVAIVSVITVDGADTKYNQAVGYTYGKFVINNVIYGNLKQGDVLDYMKSGGTMTLEEYDKYQLPEMREKHERLRQESGLDASQVYVNLHFANDPDIEAGKTYLCYIKYIESTQKYEIIGLGNGFREVNIPIKDVVSSEPININNYDILNNTTGKYESLIDYINNYINE